MNNSGKDETAGDDYGDIAVDAAPVTAKISHSGQRVYYTFSGGRGEFVGLGISEVHELAGNIALFGPDGAELTSQPFSSDGGQLDPMALPASGIYTIRIDPGLTTGSLALHLSADRERSIEIDGTAVVASVNRPGQNTRITFMGQQGQHLGIAATEINGLAGRLVLFDPEGRQMTEVAISPTGSQVDPPVLPVSGRYTLKLDPVNTVGDVALELTTDYEGQLSVGNAVVAELHRPGQNGRYTFVGTAGRTVSISASAAMPMSGQLRIHGSDGSLVGFIPLMGTSSQLYVRSLPVSDTYTVTVDPGLTIGDYTLNLWSN